MNELHAHATSGLTLYAVLLNSGGQAWNGSAFVVIDGDAWASYDIALTEAAGGIYLATMPAVTAGVYSYVVYERAGGSPAVTDAIRGGGWLAWDGSGEITPASAAGVLAATLEGALDVGEALRVMLAVLAGKSAGSGTPAIRFYGQDGATERLAATVDGTGNRTAVVLDGEA